MNRIKALDKIEQIGYTMKGLTALMANITTVAAGGQGDHIYDEWKFYLIENTLENVIEELDKLHKEVEKAS